MKTTFLIQFLALAVFASPVPQFETEAESSVATIRKHQLDKEIEAIPGIVHKGKLVYKQGFRTKDGGKGKVTEKTLFQIGSCTKLVDEGKLDWNTPVTSVYPVKLADPVANAQASLIDILSHRSGFAEPGALFISWSEWENVLSRIQDTSAPVQLRQEFQYSNIMAALAGNIGGKVSGLIGGWDELVTRNIFGPIGMTSSFSNARIVPSDADYSQGFHSVDGKLQAYSLNDTYLTDSTKPAGSIVSNIEDLAKWVAVINKRGILPNGTSLISPQQYGKLTKPHISAEPAYYAEEFKSYGVGWFLASYRGKVNIGHGGSTPGYTTQIDTFPNDDLAIIVLTNMQGSVSARLSEQHQQAQYDADAVMIATRHNGTVPSQPFVKYEGLYSSPTFGTIQLKLSDSTNHYYSLEWKGEQEGRVKVRGVMGHWEFDTFGLFEFSVTDYKNYTVPTLPVMFSPDGNQFQLPVSQYTVATFNRTV
ncbi:hypothetical protein HDU79_010318 [Rhizoclosmatium sp. JEL0117]|nr:hypothetical protein HDU79_010318 [Rhizoclosmatium sp. JEL0117]